MNDREFKEFVKRMEYEEQRKYAERMRLMNPWDDIQMMDAEFRRDIAVKRERLWAQEQKDRARRQWEKQIMMGVFDPIPYGVEPPHEIIRYGKAKIELKVGEVVLGKVRDFNLKPGDNEVKLIPPPKLKMEYGFDDLKARVEHDLRKAFQLNPQALRIDPDPAPAKKEPVYLEDLAIQRKPKGGAFKVKMRLAEWKPWADGGIVGHTKNKEPIRTTPVKDSLVENGIMYVRTRSGSIYQLDKPTEAMLQSWQADPSTIPAFLKDNIGLWIKIVKPGAQGKLFEDD